MNNNMKVCCKNRDGVAQFVSEKVRSLAPGYVLTMIINREKSGDYCASGAIVSSSVDTENNILPGLNVHQLTSDKEPDGLFQKNQSARKSLVERNENLLEALRKISNDAPKDEAAIRAMEDRYMNSSVPEDVDGASAAAWARLHLARIARAALEQSS